ncbi:MAG: hypoxanthine phosphoribosyltransferase [Candidatus Marinimicrobia bacterium]|nr:hypoxanthine phosphoribosyltransferase [Candidatus Neomarinimicrobiota bacterium]
MIKTDYDLKMIISTEQIEQRVQELADDISNRFKEEVPILIGILNGSFIFLSDLMRAMSIDCEMDFIKLASYAGQSSTGTVKLLKDISATITNRHVIVVEDIIDSGLTIQFLTDRLRGASPKSLTIVTLLMKPDITRIDFPIDYVGFEIPPEFVVGYGLDYDQKLRHLPAIYQLKGID